MVENDRHTSLATLSRVSNEMSIVSLKIPQIGEGLQEARIVAMLKQPGDFIKRDEPIYQMETDKAVMDVESPEEGTLVEWLTTPDSLLPIGAEVARIEVSASLSQDREIFESTPEKTVAVSGVPLENRSRNAFVPPRTRAYAIERGLSESELGDLASASAKLLPADIDAYLATKDGKTRKSGFEDRPLANKQRLLASRLVRGTQNVVPGTMSIVVEWTAVEAARSKIKASGDPFQPSAFTMFAHMVAKTLADHPGFRSSLREDNLRTYRHVELGIAVSLPGDELVLAVVSSADSLSWREFADQAREKIHLARSGVDQVSEAVTFSLTNMQAHGIREAVPVVVAPAVATLFIGEVYLAPSIHKGGEWVHSCNLGLTFDHRVLNGVGAAAFLNDLRKKVESIEEWLV